VITRRACKRDPSVLCAADWNSRGTGRSGEEADGETMGTFSLVDFLAHAALTVSGHLRRRPDPACESALRTAFAELDSELAAILVNRAAPYFLR
jgi:hypothetical protein